MINLDNLKNEIIMIPPSSPVIIYIGVGAAASAIQNNVLPLENYQQFPPFLQDLHNKVHHLHTFLLLIDTYQENPPKVTVDYHLHDQYDSQCHYRGERLQAFVYRMSVYTEPDFNHLANGLNITSLLSNLNQFAREKHVTLIYHDFTGRRVSLLAEYFDQENKNHLDQIVYGMSAREEHGCFFDLTKENAYFPYRIEPPSDPNTRPILKLFNYYKFIMNDTYTEIDKELAKFPQTMHPLAVVQKNQIIYKVREKFKNLNLSILRQVLKFVQMSEGVGKQDQDPPDEQELEDQAEYLFTDLPKIFHQLFTDLFKEKEYKLVYELLFNYTASELDIITKLKPMVMTGEELLTFITMDEDPYKWYNVIGSLI
jgi:hypothetical protein